MIKSFRRISLVGLLLYNFAFNAQSLAQEKQLKKINWGVTSLSAGNWIPWLAKEAKIYEKHGLDVQLVLLRGSGQTSAALLGGSIFAAPVVLPTLMLADLSGADLINVAHTVSAVNSKLVVKPEIKRVEDMRGKRIANSSLGSLGDFLFKHILRKYGLDPIREVTWLAIGTPPERLQALFSGVVDAIEASYPIDVQAERKGFRVLLDARKEVVYPSMSIVTRRKSIIEDRDTVMRMVRAHVEGIAYFKQNKEFSLRVLEQAVENHRPRHVREFVRNLHAGFHLRAVPDYQGPGSHLRFRRPVAAGDSQPQAGRVRRRELHRRVGEERVYQEAL